MVARRAEGELAPGPDWPTEYGGLGLSLLDRSILAEELMKVGAPAVLPLPNDWIGLVLLGPTLLAFGTNEQKARFLPGTLSSSRGAQGYSEPDAGSDLFSLRTKATRVGDTWRITGQKTWQTAGTTANWIFVLARTEPSSRGGSGLSFFLLRLEQPGITVRGIRNMVGQIDFAEVFFDGAEAQDAHLIGGEGNGAKVALGLLGFERGAGGMAAVAAAQIEIDRLVRLTRARGLHQDAGRPTTGQQLLRRRARDALRRPAIAVAGSERGTTGRGVVDHQDPGLTASSTRERAGSRDSWVGRCGVRGA